MTQSEDKFGKSAKRDTSYKASKLHEQQISTSSAINSVIRNKTFGDNVTHKWSKNTTLIVGDSMISGIDETGISRKGRVVKVRPFSGATIEDMYDYLKPMLRKCPENVILRVGTNNAAREPARIVFDKLLSLKSFIEKTLPNCKISMSNLIKRTDSNEAAKTMNFCLLYNSILSIIITLPKAN